MWISASPYLKTEGTEKTEQAKQSLGTEQKPEIPKEANQTPPFHREKREHKPESTVSSQNHGQSNTEAEPQQRSAWFWGVFGMGKRPSPDT